ncbi:hypothetical protein Maes01_00310 [Microbulbifer aestuariivivens]|uniref:Uncharacterized protein n=1 Tax=Microbulbifer aestuariivivens TaxID=1908308 RepID=A0ABP9WMW1_9GAMM
MSWSKPNMAAGACWGILAHREVGQFHPELHPFASAGTFSLAMLLYYNPHASSQHQELRASSLAEQFVAYLFHFYRPGFERLDDGGDPQQRLKDLQKKVYELFLQPQGKTLDHLALLLDEELVFADEVAEAEA